MPVSIRGASPDRSAGPAPRKPGQLIKTLFATGLVILFFALYPTTILAWLQRVTGMQYVTAIIIVIFAFLLLVSFHFSIMLSRARDDARRTRSNPENLRESTAYERFRQGSVPQAGM